MSIITITTDFGVGSSYVAEMKGVLLGIHPQSNLVDISHGIAPQSVSEAAFVLAQSVPAFPARTTHLIVVDPGVGTDRRIICAKIGTWNFVCPDNGLLTLVMDKYPVHSVYELDNPAFWRDQVSHTFHGRDVMSPVAAHIARGEPMESMGNPIEQPVRLEFPLPHSRDGRVHGEIISIDSFGNLITNINEASFDGFDRENLQVAIGFHTTTGLVRTFGERAHGQLVAYLGSGGHLEVATVNENAQVRLAARVGDSVIVSHSTNRA